MSSPVQPTNDSNPTLQVATVLLGSDHVGFELKEQLKSYVKTVFPNLTILDQGCFTKQRVDYPDIAQTLSQNLLLQATPSFGVLICGSGIGISIAANKVKGIRCALCHNQYTSEMARRHNDANILALGARVVEVELAKQTLIQFLSTKFDGEHHQLRVDKLDLLE